MFPLIRNYLRQSKFREITYRVLRICDGIPPYRLIYQSAIKSKAGRVSPFPAELSIETTNLCNARCTICAHPQMKRSKGKMESSLVMSLIEQGAEGGARKLYLSGFGEPLLDSRLPEFVAHARARSIPIISVMTNGSLLNRQQSTDLLDAGLNEIYISMDGFTPKSYAKIRAGLRFEEVVENIKTLHSLIKSNYQKRSESVRVIISSVDLVSNRNERRAAKDLLGKHVDSIYFRQAQGWTSDYGRELVGYSPHYAPNSIPCRYLWDGMSVYIDGRIPACCLDYEAENPMGNAVDMSLAKIWRGERFSSYRRMHLEKCKSELTPCANCGYYSVWW